MANTFKYNLSTENQALRKGNFWIGTNDVPKPTDTTGFWHGITPPFSGYSIYLNKVSNGPSIYVVDNESELISLTNRIGNLALTSATQSLNYYATQTDKMILNRDYEPIVTSGLTLCLDAGFTPSYQGSGTTWYDLGFSGSNGTLTNGPSYSGSNGGTIILDGTNDFINIPYTGITSDNFTFTIIMKCNTMNSSGINRQTLFGLSQNGNFAFRQFDVEIWGNNGQGFRGNGGPTENVDFFGYSWTLGADANNINIYTITLNSSGQTIYVNGQLRNTISQPYVSNFNSMTLGVRGGGGQFWNGQCYHFNVYNRLLSNQEILQNYQAIFPRFLGKNIITNGLVEYLDASYINSYPTTGTTWTNVSGISGGTGILTNGPTYSGVSINFDGVDDFVNIPNSSELNPTNQITISCFLRLTNLRNSTYESIVVKENFLTSSFGGGQYGLVGWRGGLSSNGIFFRLGIGSQVLTVSSNVNNTDILNRWVHVTAVYDGSRMYIYYDSILKNSANATGNINVTSAPLAIGRNGVTGGDFISGNISNVSLYNRALSQSEIFQNYQAQFPTILGENIIMNGLIYYLDAGYRTSYPTTGTTWYDVSGVSGRTATLSNGPIYTGTSGGAIIMDGVDDKITISSATTESTGIRLGSSTSPWMVNVWIKTTAAGSDSINTFPILTNQSGGPVYSSMGIAAGGVMKYSHYNSAWIVDKGTIPVNDGNWHMLTWVNLNNNTMNLYVDGVFDRNISSIISGGGNINPVDSIGYGWAGYLNCTIATVAIYKRSTSYSTYEVQQNFNAQKSRFGL